MKKYFITGLVILLPLALTLAIVIFLVNLLTDPFVGVVQSLLDRYGLLDHDFLILSSEHIQYVFSQILVLASLFFLTVGLGFIARLFFFHYVIKAWDYIIHKIPFIRSVYKTCQDVINTILQSDTRSFKQVVIVPFPSPDSHSIGLVTRENLPGLPTRNGKKMIAVFVPTTPNPTSGYLVMFEESCVEFLDMKVEEALKYIISCGVILNEPFKKISQEEAHQLYEERLRSEES